MLEVGCRIEHSAECDYITGKDNRVWMQISDTGNNVLWKFFMYNIPKEYIGENTQEFAEKIYTIVCETSDSALRCRNFLADFIDRGYGEKGRCGEGWLVALDLQDIKEVISEKMYYCEFGCKNNDIVNIDSNFFVDSNISGSKGILVCAYCSLCEENILLSCNEIIAKLYEAASENCVITQQYTVDKSLKNGNAFCMIYH